jgi:hypothetical protein
VFSSISGEGGGEFLKNATSARAAGMGNAYVAVSDNANATYYNPAGLSLIEGREITSMVTDMFDIKYHNICYAQKIKNNGFGINMLFAESDKIEARDENMNLIGTFKYSASALYLSWGRVINENLNTGISLKYIKQKIYDTNGDGLGFDLGFLYKYNNNLKIGLNLQDITETQLNWDKSEKIKNSEGAKDKIPLNIKFGIVYKIQNPKLKIENLLFVLDMEKQKDMDSIYHLGCEYLINENIALRIGSDDGYFTGGFGIKFKQFQLDYSFKNHSIDNVSRVSFGYRF